MGYTAHCLEDEQSVFKTYLQGARPDLLLMLGYLYLSGRRTQSYMVQPRSLIDISAWVSSPEPLIAGASGAAVMLSARRGGGGGGERGVSGVGT